MILFLVIVYLGTWWKCPVVAIAFRSSCLQSFSFFIDSCSYWLLGAPMHCLLVF